MAGPVSTGMGDPVWGLSLSAEQSQYIASHPG